MKRFEELVQKELMEMKHKTLHEIAEKIVTLQNEVNRLNIKIDYPIQEKSLC